MFKGLGLAGFGIFLVLSGLLLQSSPGWGFAFGVLIAVFCGTTAVFFLNVNPLFFRVWSEVSGPSALDAHELLLGIEEAAGVIRQDGLLALEARRKDLRDPHLKYLLKRIMDGFEGKDLIPWVLNQKDLRMEALRMATDSADRFLGQVPSVGLMSSLILMIGVLATPDRSRDLIGVSQAFVPFLITIGLQMLLDSEFGKKWEEIRMRNEHYFDTLESGIAGIQSGLNPELLSDRLRARIQPGKTWAEK
ncbi:MAG: hypothetical protein KGP28_04540 [Bdellovibrionales bacterium]|nr:hypothetical protein [Bdellovibrionales bacterium]